MPTISQSEPGPIRGAGPLAQCHIRRAWLELLMRSETAQLLQYVAYTACVMCLEWQSNYGDRSFSVNGPVVCNSLPHDLRSTDISLSTFRKRLKAFLFETET